MRNACPSTHEVYFYLILFQHIVKKLSVEKFVFGMNAERIGQKNGFIPVAYKPCICRRPRHNNRFSTSIASSMEIVVCGSISNDGEFSWSRFRFRYCGASANFTNLPQRLPFHFAFCKAQ